MIVLDKEKKQEHQYFILYAILHIFYYNGIDFLTVIFWRISDFGNHPHL